MAEAVAASVASTSAPAAPSAAQAIEPLVKVMGRRLVGQGCTLQVVLLHQLQNPTTAPAKPGWQPEKRITRPGHRRRSRQAERPQQNPASTAEATFVQHYRSKGFNDAMNKTLQYQLENGQWKIIRESNR